MGSKSKKRSKGRAAVNPIDQAKRNLDRGDYKQALKALRVSYRKSPGPECRCLLEHAYIGRAQQLLRNGQIDDSRRIARELIELGVTEPTVEAGLPDLLLSVGMFDRLPQGTTALTAEDRGRLRVKAADQAVARPENVPKSMAELRDEAERIRAALEAVQREDEAVALEHLKAIPRQSLFADWKYFVRGLIAYYQRRETDLAANWDRLDPDRAAARIAAPLKVMAGVVSARQDSALRLKVNHLEKQATNQTVLGQVIRLRESAVVHDWPKVLNTLSTVHGDIRRLDADAYQRLAASLSATFVGKGLVDELERLSRIVDPPPADPHWNRAKALSRERSKFHDHEDAEEYWRAYLQDLENPSTLSPSLRDLARGLVWLHLAQSCAAEAIGLRGCNCGFDHGEEIEEAEQDARDAFERSFALAPTHTAAYADAAEFHLAADRTEEALRVYRRLLEHVPDNIEALLFISNHYLAEGEWREARQFLERAREEKPLDKTIVSLLQTSHVEAARGLARSKRYDQARDELATADLLDPAWADDYRMLARKAVLEIKAKNNSAARGFREQAQERLKEPAALWLAMTIEAIRYDLPKEEKWRYEKRWRAALKRRCRGETAGHMCRMLVEHLKMPRRYPHCREHVGYLRDYVRRCSRVKWQVEELRCVCEFLEEAQELDILAKFAKKGVRVFPQVGYFHWVMAMAETAKGPIRCDRQLVRDRLQDAIDLASVSRDPRDKPVVASAKQALSLTEDLRAGVYEDCEEDDDFFDGEDEGPFDASMDSDEREEILNIILAACKRAGIDPEDVLDEFENVESNISRRKRTRK